MNPEDVPSELVEKAARATNVTSLEGKPSYERTLRTILAAVLDEAQIDARLDLINDLIAWDLWPVRHTLNGYPTEAVPKSALLERRNRLARLRGTTADEVVPITD